MSKLCYSGGISEWSQHFPREWKGSIMKHYVNDITITKWLMFSMLHWLSPRESCAWFEPQLKLVPCCADNTELRVLVIVRSIHWKLMENKKNGKTTPTSTSRVYNQVPLSLVPVKSTEIYWNILKPQAQIPLPVRVWLCVGVVSVRLWHIPRFQQSICRLGSLARWR